MSKKQGSVGRGGKQHHEESTPEYADEGRRGEGATRGNDLRTGRGADARLCGALARYILQVSFEGGATTLLGRGHCRRGERAHPGWRNAYAAKRLQTEAGLLELAVPQMRATPEPFRPTLVERMGARTPDPEGLVRGMYVRGLSTRVRERPLWRSVCRGRLCHYCI
jgi:transposase-like protein